MDMGEGSQKNEVEVAATPEDVDMAEEDSADSDDEDAPPPTLKPTASVKRKAKRALITAEKKAHKEGEAPTKACERCAQAGHYTFMCPQMKEKQAKRKAKKAKVRKERAAAAAEPDKPTDAIAAPRQKKKPTVPAASQGSKVKRTRRAEREEQHDNEAFGDGCYVILKIPQVLEATMTETKLGNTTMGSTRDTQELRPIECERMGKNWRFKYSSKDIAKAACEAGIKFLKEEYPTLKKDTIAYPALFRTAGPQAYVCFAVGPYTEEKVVELVRGQFKDGRFWMGRYHVGPIKMGKILVIFEVAQEVREFVVKESNDFELRFKAVNRSKPCQVCGDGMHGVLDCPEIARMITGGTLVNRPDIQQ